MTETIGLKVSNSTDYRLRDHGSNVKPRYSIAVFVDGKFHHTHSDYDKHKDATEAFEQEWDAPAKALEEDEARKGVVAALQKIAEPAFPAFRCEGQCVDIARAALKELRAAE